MSQTDILSFRMKAEALLRQAMRSDDQGERSRLVDLAAQWHAVALMATRTTRKVA